MTFLQKQLMTIKNQWKPRAKMWVKLTRGDQVFHLWSRLEELTEPRKGILWAAELYGEQGEGWGYLVNWKKAGVKAKERSEVGRRRCHLVQVPVVDSLGFFKS